MEFFNQIKWLKSISRNLPLFKDSGNNVYNCRCIICGDSKKDKHKARGYFYKLDNSLIYKCHNCGASLSFLHFLKDNFPNEYNQAIMEIVSDSSHKNEESNPILNQQEIMRQRGLQRLSEIQSKRKGKEVASLLKLSELSNDNPAKQYIINRNLGEFLNLFYYIPDVGKLMAQLPAYKDWDIKPSLNKPAIGIPHWNLDKSRLEFLQCRFFHTDNSKMKYLTLRIMALDETSHKIYGLERVDFSKPYINVTEGAFDSLTLDNSIAISGLQSWKQALGGEITDSNREKIRFIVDNDWDKNKQVNKVLHQIINEGFRVVIFPKDIRQKYKDLNDMYKVMSRKDLKNLVNKHTYAGLQAQLKASET